MRFRVWVLPTRVGMVRVLGQNSINPLRSPHTRGDGPVSGGSPVELTLFSPHAWGWSGAIH